ncbi:hypothetical protein CSA08_00380 [Candidatus Gracilibacteria bacterium]|nr:MAG: hypothetical protein CSA08_00380 [Candidatus Gracilibacteria bacterium]
MYTLTRQEVADELGISTRSIDRYIKSGKLRSKKQGKIVYVNNKDVENLKSSGNNYQEVIVPKKKKMKEEIVIKKNEKDSFGLESVYIDLREQIKEKDELIQKLSLSLGKSEEIIKNSISLIDYKKSQFLLEESKGYLSKEIESLQEEKEVLLKELKYEKSSNVILIIFTVLLFIVAIIIWFVQI